MLINNGCGDVGRGQPQFQLPILIFQGYHRRGNVRNKGESIERLLEKSKSRQVGTYLVALSSGNLIE